MIRIYSFIYLLYRWIFVWMNKKANQKVDLVIIRTDLIGDYVIWHDTLSAYKIRFADKKIILVCSNVVKPLADQEEFFTEVIGFDNKRLHQSLSYKNEFLSGLRNISAYTLINPMWERHQIGDLFSFFVRAEKKIALEANNSKGFFIRLRDLIYNNRISADNLKNEIEVAQLFTQKVLFQSYSYGHYPLRFKQGYNIGLSCYIVISLSASKEKRIWNIDRLIEIIDYLPPKYNIVLTGSGNADVLRGQYVQNHSNNPKRITNLVNKTSLIDLISVISGAKMVIGNDSAAVHIAAATRTPSLCIFHGAQFGRFLPYPQYVGKVKTPTIVFKKLPCYGCNYKCKFKFENMLPCLSMVSVDMVKEKIDTMIKGF